MEIKVCYCKECYAQYSAPIIEHARSAADAAAKGIKVKFLHTHTGRTRSNRTRWTFQITWPKEYSPSPVPILSVEKLPPVLERFIGTHGEDTVLPIDVVRESELLINYFVPVSFDYLIQRTLNKSAGCVYLSDSEREIRQIEDLAGEGMDAKRNEILASMSHEIPLFANIRLETLSEVRRLDGDAFAAYRAALDQAASEASREGTTAERSRQIYFDVIQPKLSALERKYEVMRKRSKTDLILSYGVPAATLAMGVICGASHGVGGVLEITGGLQLVKNLAKELQPIQQTDAALDPIRSDPMYFLLKMKKAHAKDCSG
jgi:hypothetical protein